MLIFTQLFACNCVHFFSRILTISGNKEQVQKAKSLLFFSRILTISGNKEQVQKAKSLLPPCVTVGNPQDLRPKVEVGKPTGHLPTKKNLPVLKWKTNARFKRMMNRWISFKYFWNCFNIFGQLCKIKPNTSLSIYSWSATKIFCKQLLLRR